MMSNSVIFLSVGAVGLVLIAGLWNLVRRNSSPSLSQNLMRWRVGLQFAAIVMAMVALWLAQ